MTLDLNNNLSKCQCNSWESWRYNCRALPHQVSTELMHINKPYDSFHFKHDLHLQVIGAGLYSGVISTPAHTKKPSSITAVLGSSPYQEHYLERADFSPPSLFKTIPDYSSEASICMSDELSDSKHGMAVLTNI